MGELTSIKMSLRTKCIWIFCVCLLTSWWCPNVEAIANPYDAIGERNIFGLKDPPPDVPETVEQEPEPPPNIKVTGITTIQGIPRVLLKVQTPAKPPEPAREESYVLVAGGLGRDGVEVLAIDESYGKAKEIRVKVRTGGKDSWLPLEKDTPKAAAAPAVAAGPGGPPQTPAQRMAAARMANANPRTATPPNPNISGLPTRPIRTGQQGIDPNQSSGQSSVNLGTATANQRHVYRDYGLSRDEQVILIEANREMSVEDVALGNMPPLPPTELTPPELDPTAGSGNESLEQLFPSTPQ